MELVFKELYSRDGLMQLDDALAKKLDMADVTLFDSFKEAHTGAFNAQEHAQLSMQLSPYVNEVMQSLLAGDDAEEQLQMWRRELSSLYSCKRTFIPRAATALKPEEAERINPEALLQMLPLVPAQSEHFELVFAKVITGWLESENENKSLLEIAARYGAWALQAEEGKARHADGLLFKQTGSPDFTAQLFLHVAEQNVQTKH